MRRRWLLRLERIERSDGVDGIAKGPERLTRKRLGARACRRVCGPIIPERVAKLMPQARVCALRVRVIVIADAAPPELDAVDERRIPTRVCEKGRARLGSRAPGAVERMGIEVVAQHDVVEGLVGHGRRYGRRVAAEGQSAGAAPRLDKRPYQTHVS